ncbi:MAG: ATP-dependent DNA ligase [Chitinophagales bacterium]
MKQFAALIEALMGSTKTTDKLEALQRYFLVAENADKIWTLALFSGRRPKRTVSSRLLHLWCAEAASLPLWLFEECYHTVGDLSETIALTLPPPQTESNESLSFWISYLKALQGKTDDEKKIAILHAWNHLGKTERFVFNKLMSATFRIGVSQALVVQALASIYQVDAQVMTHRITGNWDPETMSFELLMEGKHANADVSKPYPFYLAYALEDEVETLGAVEDWQAEWKWDGIRGQIIKREGELFVWSRGEELLTEKFPEYEKLKHLIPDGSAIDGEIICHSGHQPLPFSVLQTRIGRKLITKKILEQAPVAFIAYDILEWNGEDVRTQTQQQRRVLLEKWHQSLSNEPSTFLISPLIEFASWEALRQIRLRAREMMSEGVMLKRKDSIYQAGRKRGDWWKWKVDPLSVDAVLVAAQRGHGRRSNLYTDYTFALKNENGELVTFAKAYSGLTDKEFVEVDAFIKKNIREKFGPVRTVTASLVFEIGFEGIAASSRHKSGVAVRFPRMLRWRKDKTVSEINTLDDLKALLKVYSNLETDAK